MDPSTTSTNGSSSPRSALCHHSMKLSAPCSGPHSKSISGQCTAIFGSPGSAPRTISSMLGWVAAVRATESPSQLRPPFIQRMCTAPSSARVGASATLVMLNRPCVDLPPSCGPGSVRVTVGHRSIAPQSASPGTRDPRGQRARSAQPHPLLVPGHDGGLVELVADPGRQRLRRLGLPVHYVHRAGARLPGPVDELPPVGGGGVPAQADHL